MDKNHHALVRSLCALLVLGGTSGAFAQNLELPRPSPNAKVSQIVGLTEISVEYSAPGVKGRKIFGNLVPYDKLWRAGANAATKVTFSRDVKIDGKPVPAGSYAFFVIPGKSAWTAILNKDVSQMGTGANYKQELDLLRVSVKPMAIPLRERLSYQVIDFDDFHASLALEWEKVRIAVPLQVDTDAQVNAAVDSLEKDAWRNWNMLARFELDSKKDYDKGLGFAERSLQLKEDWQNDWTKAQLLAAKGKYKEAYPLAQRAQELGQQSPMFFAADDVKKALVNWKGK